MFIKLTAWKSDSKQGEPVYLNPLTITSIKADDTSITHVGTTERSGMNNILIFFLGSIFGTLVALMVFAMFHINDND